MADNAAGNYILESNLYSGDDLLAQQKAAGNKASSNHVDSIFVDLKGAMNNRLNSNGLKPMTGNLDMGGNTIVNYGSNNDDVSPVLFSKFDPTFLTGSWNYSTQEGDVISIGDMNIITIRIDATLIAGFGSTLEISSLPVSSEYDVPVCFGSASITDPGITSSDVNGFYQQSSDSILIFSKDNPVFIQANVSIRCQVILKKS